MNEINANTKAEYEKTAKQIVKEPWSMTNGAKYLNEWLSNKLWKEATCKPPEPVPYLRAHLGHSEHVRTMTASMEEFATRAPTTQIWVKAGAPKRKRAEAKPKAKAKKKRKAKARAKLPKDLEDISGMSLLDSASAIAETFSDSAE